MVPAPHLCPHVHIHRTRPVTCPAALVILAARAASADCIFPVPVLLVLTLELTGVFLLALMRNVTIPVFRVDGDGA